MKKRSFETCHDIARLHLLPASGGLKLKDLTHEHIQRLYPCKRGAGLSAATVYRIHDVPSPALKVSPPRIPAPEIRPFSKEEAKRFLAAAEHD